MKSKKLSIVLIITTIILIIGLGYLGLIYKMRDVSYNWCNLSGGDYAFTEECNDPYNQGLCKNIPKLCIRGLFDKSEDGRGLLEPVQQPF
ncbi:hypothetical protein IPJ72_00410 [Candidatus Peregrinibacteria bacterium]|nr:MAG: hypothetical protein IPJ72_00410 [Candidatus Peregrinibacteria bacterium]